MASVFVVLSVAPVFIGEGIPLIARRHRHEPLGLLSSERLEDGAGGGRYCRDFLTHEPTAR